MALAIINGSRIYSSHGYARAFSGFGGLRGGLGSLPALTDSAENRTFQAVLNRYSGRAKFTPIKVDGKIGARETAPAARTVATWLVENVGGISYENDYIQALRSQDTNRIAAEAGRFADILNGQANTLGLPTTTSGGQPFTPVSVVGLPAPSVSAPAAGNGRTSGTVITPVAVVGLPGTGTPAGGLSRGVMAAGAAVAAIGLVLILGGKRGGKRRRR